ncbi:MAG TPA: hypothetical protein ENI80_00710 [Acidiferrobacteraceae bacterium]|nr:hypothetical protein [Acidiferrobacteraceae bacterium]
MAINRDKDQLKPDSREYAILSGLQWVLVLVDDDSRFEYIASDYLLMLEELETASRNSAMGGYVEALSRQALSRLAGRLATVFPITEPARHQFIAILPYVYKYGVEVDKFVGYYRLGLGQLPLVEEKSNFDNAVKSKDYSTLTDIIINVYYQDRLHKRFPKNTLGIDLALSQGQLNRYLAKLATLDFAYDYTIADKYSLQNYYVTHLIFVMSDFGRHAPIKNGLSQRLEEYLLTHFDAVRNIVNDRDLLAEFIHCLKILGHDKLPKLRGAERYLLGLQDKQGSWTSPYYQSGDAYDQFHPTWTVLTALNYESPW